MVKPLEVDAFINQAPPLSLEEELNKKPRVAIIKTQEIIKAEGYVNPKASWLRYERFCKNNDIPYGFYDITKSDWISKAEEFDIFVCHTEGTPSFQDMIEPKIYVLEKILGKLCFPSHHEIWQYENKVRAQYLYQSFRLPFIPTQVTYSEQEAYDIIENIDYPFITKTTIGAGSTGVKKVNTKKEARNLIKKIFGPRGLKTQFLYQRQKNYFYIQKFIDDATFDLRIMLVGNMAFGYYRYPDVGDFRASGAGNFEKKAIPLDALQLAIEIRNKLKSRQMGVDLLYSEKHKQYFIIETSLFNQIDTPAQLSINGIPGYYDISNANNISFKEGKFWLQELILRDIVLEWNGMSKNN